MNEIVVATLAMAIAYLVVVRILDFNEKEPLWAVLLLFGLGAVAGGLVVLSGDTAFLELSGIAGVMVIELARFLAIAGGFVALGAVARSRGYSEVNGLMDGVVYGVSGGLGFATGLAYARGMLIQTEWLVIETSVPRYGELALVGLSDGLFGALVGIGFAVALGGRSAPQRAFGPFAGYIAAVSGHVVYDIIGKADAYGDAALLRKWIALLLPVVIVAVVAVVALSGEKRAIQEELESEAVSGVVTLEDLSLLKSASARQGLYVKTLFTADFGRWSTLHDLHNRQVQLALAKRKLRLLEDGRLRTLAAAELKALRDSIAQLKEVLGLRIEVPKLETEDGVGDAALKEPAAVEAEKAVSPSGEGPVTDTEGAAPFEEADADVDDGGES
jgi:hypothetical protein